MNKPLSEKTENSRSKAEAQVTHVCERFKSVYMELTRQTLTSGLLESVYDEDMYFEDSFHRIGGLANFKRYCDSLYENVSHIEFVFHNQWLHEHDAMLNWTMTYVHPKLNRGQVIEVDGASYIRFNDKVFFHKDYFDGGKLLYEQLPLLRTVIRQLKKRMF